MAWFVRCPDPVPGQETAIPEPVKPIRRHLGPHQRQASDTEVSYSDEKSALIRRECVPPKPTVCRRSFGHTEKKKTMFSQLRRQHSQIFAAERPASRGKSQLFTIFTSVGNCRLTSALPHESFLRTPPPFVEGACPSPGGWQTTSSFPLGGIFSASILAVNVFYSPPGKVSGSVQVTLTGTASLYRPERGEAGTSGWGARVQRDNRRQGCYLGRKRFQVEEVADQTSTTFSQVNVWGSAPTGDVRRMSR